MRTLRVVQLRGAGYELRITGYGLRTTIFPFTTTPLMIDLLTD
jgi:hypothetical protein